MARGLQELNDSNADSTTKTEKCLLLKDLISSIPESVKLELKQLQISKLLSVLKSSKTSLYNTDSAYRYKVHRVLEFSFTKGASAEKINFSCKSRNDEVLPHLNGDQMNCQGSAKIRDVIEYICNEDGLFKHIDKSKLPPRLKRDGEEIPYHASDFIQLYLLADLKDENGKKQQVEIPISPSLTLETVKKYMYVLIEMNGGEAKYMPMHYTLKDPSLSTYKKGEVKETPEEK